MQEVTNIIGPFLTWLLMGNRNFVRLKLADTTVQVYVAMSMWQFHASWRDGIIHGDII